MPEFPIVDAHVHLYDPGVVTFPWMKAVPKLDRPYLPADFRALTDGVEIEALVFVEVDAAPGQNLKEAEWVDGLTAVEPRLRGMVASIPLEKGEGARAELDAYRRLGIARGVRRLIERHADEPGWSLHDDFVAGVRMLPDYGFTFDLCLYHRQLAEVTELCRRCPEVRFVIDHIAKPGVRDGLTEPWRREMREIARLPNVFCKISGVVTEADHARWTEAEVAPYIAHAIDCFGFDRVVYGGDWPVSELASTYRRWVDLVDSVVAGASETERRKLYRDNAIAFYRL
ncbi:MAG TPA: amidohydrolase family protein [Bauldia sp.]|nr:amidohydrolase family protein [Bauldia sp.]